MRGGQVSVKGDWERFLVRLRCMGCMGRMGKVPGVFGEGLFLRGGPSPRKTKQEHLWGRFGGEGIGLKIRPSPNPSATFPKLPNLLHQIHRPPSPNCPTTFTKSIGYLHPLLQHLHHFGKKPSYSEVLFAVCRLEADGLVSTDLLRRCTIAPEYD